MGWTGLFAPEDFEDIHVEETRSDRPKRFHDAYFSKEQRYSIGTDTTSGDRYLSIPVSSSAVDYEEYYEITPAQYEQLLADSSAAIEVRRVLPTARTR